MEWLNNIRKNSEVLTARVSHVFSRCRDSFMPFKESNDGVNGLCLEILQDQNLSAEEIRLILGKVEELFNEISKSKSTEELEMNLEETTKVQFCIGLCVTAAALLGITLFVVGPTVKKRLSQYFGGQKDKPETLAPNAVPIKLPQSSKWMDVQNFLLSQPRCHSAVCKNKLFLTPDVIKKLKGYGLWTASLVEDISRLSNGRLKEIIPEIGDEFDAGTMEEEVGLTGQRKVLAVNWPGLRDETNGIVLSKAFVSVQQI